MDNFHLKHDGNYIDDLIEKINKTNKKQEGKIQSIKKIKESINIFKNAVKMDRNELFR